MSMATGAVLSGVTGAGVLLIIVALTENCRAMLVCKSFKLHSYSALNIIISPLC